MTENLDPKKLRAVAEAATPGPWTLEYDNADDYEAGINDGDYPNVLHGPRNCSFDHWTNKNMVQDQMNRVSEISEMVDADAEFIAAFDPQTVLALLSHIEQAELHVKSVRELHTEYLIYEWDRESNQPKRDANGDPVILARLCRGCSSFDAITSAEDSEWEDGEYYDAPYPCPTIEALDGESND